MRRSDRRSPNRSRRRAISARHPSTPRDGRLPSRQESEVYADILHACVVDPAGALAQCAHGAEHDLWIDVASLIDLIDRFPCDDHALVEIARGLLELGRPPWRTCGILAWQVPWHRWRFARGLGIASLRLQARAANAGCARQHADQAGPRTNADASDRSRETAESGG
jgi:hypothetical protein